MDWFQGNIVMRDRVYSCSTITFLQSSREILSMLFSSPGRIPGRASVLPPASALASALLNFLR